MPDNAEPTVNMSAVHIPDGTLAMVPVPVGAGGCTAIFGRTREDDTIDLTVVTNGDWDMLKTLFDLLAEECLKAKITGVTMKSAEQMIETGEFVSPELEAKGVQSPQTRDAVDPETKAADDAVIEQMEGLL